MEQGEGDGAHIDAATCRRICRSCLAGLLSLGAQRPLQAGSALAR